MGEGHKGFKYCILQLRTGNNMNFEISDLFMGVEKKAVPVGGKKT